MAGGSTSGPLGPTQAYWVFDDLVEIKLSGAQTDGAYCVIEDWPAPSFSPAQHVHRREEELVCILAGDFVYASGEHEQRLEPGAIVRVPAGVPHGFRNVGEAAGHRLVVFTPAGPDALWAEVGIPAEDRDTPPQRSIDLRAFLAAAQRHGLDVVRR